MAEFTKKMADDERVVLMDSIGNYQQELAESIINGGGDETIETVAKLSVKKPSKVRMFLNKMLNVLSK